MSVSSANGPVLLVGGGIGGLTCALALAKRGIAVEVFESADMLSDIGAGLQLSPNAMRVLQNLGLANALQKDLGMPSSLALYSGQSGAKLGTVPLGDKAVSLWKAPYAVSHRGDLQQALISACNAQELITTHLGCSFSEYKETADNVTLHFTRNGASHQLAGAALIGADGLWSKVRAQFLHDGPPEFSGYNSYRALLPTSALPAGLDGTLSGLWMAPHAHIVHYPLRGGTLTNIVVILQDNEADPAPDVDLASFYFATSQLAPMLRLLLRAPDSWSCWPLYTRTPSSVPLPVSRVTLLGDAAHPMLPFLAQGAAQAIEDASILAACYAEKDATPLSAFQAYRTERAPRTMRVQVESEKNARIFHMRGIMAKARDLALKLSSEKALLSRYDWLYRL